MLAFGPEHRGNWLFGIVERRAVFLHLLLEDGLSSVTYLFSVIDSGTGGAEDNDDEGRASAARLAKNINRGAAAAAGRAEGRERAYEEDQDEGDH
jgi:hypothetical protein